MLSYKKKGIHSLDIQGKKIVSTNTKVVNNETTIENRSARDWLKSKKFASIFSSIHGFRSKKLKEQWNDPLYRNSFYLLANNVIGSAIAFLFWVAAARLYTTEEIGIATALISASAFILMLSRMGFDFSIIRFFPTRDKSDVFNTTIFVTSLVSLLLGIIFVIGIDFFSPNLSVLKNNIYALVFLLYILLTSVTTFTGQTFLAMRKGNYFFLQNRIADFRIIFIFIFISWGALGIYNSFWVSVFFAFGAALFLLKSHLKLGFSFKRDFFRESLKFSGGNYAASLFSSIPALILPLLVLNLLGVKEAAYYYISYAIASIIFMIPNAVSTSLFVEGSHGESLKKSVVKSYTMIFVLLIPVVLITYFFGHFILSFLGKSYLESLELLKIFALSSFFVAIVSVYMSVKRVQMDIKSLMLVSIGTCILTLSLSPLFLLKFGIIGIGYTWIITYGIIALPLIRLSIKQFFINK
jgi:O-antigen/teichoic acid export membrane protein